MTDGKAVAKALQVLPLPVDGRAFRDMLAPLDSADDAPPIANQNPPSDALEHTVAR
jgi:hypothetical protein